MWLISKLKKRICAFVSTCKLLEYTDIYISSKQLVNFLYKCGTFSVYVEVYYLHNIFFHSIIIIYKKRYSFIGHTETAV